MYILALEASTSSAKAMLYHCQQGVVDVLGAPYDSAICDVVTIDPQGAVDAVLEVGRKLLDKNGHPKIEVVALSSIWYHSVLYLDKNRAPLSRVLTWANTEAAPTIAKYRADGKTNNWVFQKTGNPCHSIYALWKWMHLKDHGPQQLKEKVAYISSLPEYLFMQLSGGELAVSNMTASASGMLNIHTLDWDDDVLAFAGLNRSMLSKVVEPEYASTLCKQAAERLGLPEGLTLLVPGGDGALNQIAAGALKQGVMTLSMGTSAAIRMSYPEPILPQTPSTWCYYGAEGKRIVGAATSGAGNCVEWFAKKMLLGNYKYRELDDMVAQRYSQPFDAPIFLPFNFGERCPGWDDLRLGGFYNVKGKHDGVDHYFAVLEGVLMNLYQCYRILCQNASTPDIIQISGGINKSPIWLQMAADIFNRDIEVSNMEHASTLGACAVGLKYLGQIASLEEFSQPQGKIISPIAQNVEKFAPRFLQYLDCYNQK